MYLDLYIQYDPIPELLIPSGRTFWKCCNRQLKVGKLLAYNEFNSYPEVSGKMSTLSLQAFQDQVSELLLRHQSLIDVLSKTGQAGASVNRAVSKAVPNAAASSCTPPSRNMPRRAISLKPRACWKRMWKVSCVRTAERSSALS